VPEYIEIDRQVSSIVGQINGRHGEVDWTPIRYVNRSYSRALLAGLFRSANVGLVTPLRDGMNLVAKEYVAAQDPADPGVLVLSRFAGAAAELDGALIVNPHEVEAVAKAIGTALDMPVEERKERHARMFAHLAEYNIDRWADQFLTALSESRQRPRATRAALNRRKSVNFSVSASTIAPGQPGTFTSPATAVRRTIGPLRWKRRSKDPSLKRPGSPVAPE
jgi:trehalose 6-phosphate synthase